MDASFVPQLNASSYSQNCQTSGLGKLRKTFCSRCSASCSTADRCRHSSRIPMVRRWSHRLGRLRGSQVPPCHAPRSGPGRVCDALDARRRARRSVRGVRARLRGSMFRMVSCRWKPMDCRRLWRRGRLDRGGGASHSECSFRSRGSRERQAVMACAMDISH